MAYYKCGSIHPTQNSNVVVDTASGSIANFNTQLSLPLIETIFGVSATQETGTPSPTDPKIISGVSSISANINGNTSVIQLGNTYYGGEFVQKGNKRQFIATFGMSDMGDLMYWYPSKTTTHLFLISSLRNVIKLVKKDGDSQYVGPAWWNGMCDSYKMVSNRSPSHLNNFEMDLYTHHDTGSLVDGLIYFRDDRYTISQIDDLAGFLAGQKIVYELATPTIIDLPDSTPFKTIAGTNNISCDTGNTSVKFRKIQTTG